jgi:hypothetical protein
MLVHGLRIVFSKHLILIRLLNGGCHMRSRNCSLFRSTWIQPHILVGVQVARFSAFCVVFCVSLFLLLSFFFWPLCCLSFDLWLLITPGFDINGCPIARGKWNVSSGKWKRHPACPIRQVKMILWYVQFLKSKMINIELFSVGSRGKFYLNIASYVSCILRHFVLFCWLRNSPFSKKDHVIYINQSWIIIRRRCCINIVFIFAGQWKARVICSVLILENYPWCVLPLRSKYWKRDRLLE